MHVIIGRSEYLSKDLKGSGMLRMNSSAPWNLIKKFLLILFMMFCFQQIAAERLRVGVIMNTPPFVMYKNNQYSGISIDTWKLIAQNQNLQYILVPVSEDYDQAIQMLYQNKIDVIAGPTIITYERFKLVDFSRPYFLTQVGVIEHSKGKDLGKLVYVIWEVIKSPFILAFFVYFFLYLHIIWFFERGRDTIPSSYWEGMVQVLWHNTRNRNNWTLPNTAIGRIAAFSWYITAGLFITSITAAVTSKLTLLLSFHSGQYSRPSDLENQTLAAIEGTTSAEEAKKFGGKVVYAQHVAQEVEWLRQKKVNGVVIGYIIGKNYILSHHYNDLQMASFVLRNMSIAFPIRKNSPLRNKIDTAILFLQDKNLLKPVCTTYLRSEDDKDCSL